MHHPILLLLGGLLLVRLLVRARFRRFGHYGCHGRFGGPIVLGGLDEEFGGRWLRRRARARFGRFVPETQLVRRPVDFGAALELSARQKELFDDVLAKARQALPPSTLAELLATVAREPFTREAVEFLVGPGELADDLEQLHHSLTTEQRAKLREVTAA
jgi:hypothetical protein